MTAAHHALREAMLAGDVLLSTLQRDILPADLTPGLRDVTATVWNAEMGTWHQHFAELLDEPAARAMLTHLVRVPTASF